MVFPAGAVGVVQDIDANTQRFYIQHTDKISCLRTFTVRLSATMHMTMARHGL
jgi:hypothetical protein